MIEEVQISALLLFFLGWRGVHEVDALLDRSLLVRPLESDRHSRFGQSVCISSAGDVLAVGLGQGLSTPTTDITTAGYVYEQSPEYIATESDDAWVCSELQLRYDSGSSSAPHTQRSNVGFACAMSHAGHLVALTSPGQASLRKKGFVVLFERLSFGLSLIHI